jgi:hypothetical protein
MAVPPPPQAPAHSSPTNRKTSAPVTSTRRSSSRSGSDTLRSGLAPVWLAFNQFSQRLSGGLRTITGRMLPGSDNQVPTLSTGSMWFIAIIVPLMVVAIATTIYVRSGGSQQQAQYLTSAQQAIIQAQAQTDPALQRSAWMQAKYWLDKAEEYGQNSDTRAARSQVENALDLLDNISRLDLQPVMTDKFPDSVNITRVGINGTDVYVLDSNKGSILRLTRTNQGYTPDSTFICNSGPIGGTVIAPLIEMVILPADNKLKATVMGIDPSGKLLYCGPNVPPTAVNLPTPASGWGKIVAAKLDNDVLYVLDPKNNAVWRYEGNNGSFDQMPSLFFDQQVPKQLTTVIDLATAQDELYLLHNTGEMVHCTYSHIKEVKLTECEDPAMFSDRRQNTATQQRTFAEATFTQTLTSPGNNTLLVLDNKNKSIYRFSLKLNLDKVMTLRMSDGSTLTSKDISAIGVGPGNLLIVAIGQEIYSSSLP